MEKSIIFTCVAAKISSLDGFSLKISLSVSGLQKTQNRMSRIAHTVQENTNPSHSYTMIQRLEAETWKCHFGRGYNADKMAAYP